MYTIDNLKEVNQSYDYQYRVCESDVVKVNKWIDFIKNTRDNSSPQVGDVIEYTTKYGEYYKNAHVDKIRDDELEICLSPYVPFVNENDGKLSTSTSGGPWQGAPKKLKYLGTKMKVFKDWGFVGPCGNGAVNFYAPVNVWEYKEDNPLFGEYTTKTHSKFHVTKLEEKNDFGYKYKMNFNAFKDDDEYNSWLKTYKGVEFNNGTKTSAVFTLKQLNKCVPLEEYMAIENAVVDTTLNNGSIQECKRVYDDTSVITFTPYQNRMIELDYNNPEYMAKRIDFSNIGKYKIIPLYANNIAKDYGKMEYGDIYTSLNELLNDHPDCKIIKGFGIIDKKSNICPDIVDDFYFLIKDALKVVNAMNLEAFIEEN
ncbi:MAG: DUF4121 family protein [bacterium]